MTARASALPILQYCGLYGELAAKHGAGRRAAMGRAFHAVCDDAHTEEASRALAALTDDERAEIATWHPPDPLPIEGRDLLWEDATREEAVWADADLQPCPKDEAVITGHPDAWWHVGDMIVVGDIKATAYAADGPDTLQLHAYGQILANREGADGYQLALWYADEGRWDVGERVDLHSPEGADWAERVYLAATQPPEPNTGPHCRRCWQRGHCPEWVIPDLVGALEPLTRPEPLTPEEALAALKTYERAKDTLARVKEILEAYADSEGGIVDPEAGKVWQCRPGKKPGRRLDTKMLREDHPDLAEAYTIETPPRKSGYKWFKA